MGDIGTQYFLGNEEIINSYVGDTPIIINPFVPPPYPIPLDGLVMFLDGQKNVDTSSGYWYNSYGGNVTASLFGSPTWDSGTGVLSFTHQQGFETKPTPGAIDLTYTPEYTVIYSGRYTGAITDKHGRILVSLSNTGPTNLLRNWSLGNYSGSYAGLPGVGPAYIAPDPVVGKFVFQPSGSYDTNWRIFAATAEWNDIPGVHDPRTQSLYLNGEFITSSVTSSVYPAGPYGVGVNTGSYTDGIVGSSVYENSNCEVADILIYNKLLNADEILSASLFLANRVGI
jgi:hypothetical protein